MSREEIRNVATFKDADQIMLWRPGFHKKRGKIVLQFVKIIFSSVTFSQNIFLNVYSIDVPTLQVFSYMAVVTKRKKGL